MKITEIDDLAGRMCDVENRLELLSVSVVGIADRLEDGDPPTAGVLLGLAKAIEDIQNEVNAIENLRLEHDEANYLKRHPKLAKLLAGCETPKRRTVQERLAVLCPVTDPGTAGDR
jgi:hypothetical protein